MACIFLPDFQLVYMMYSLSDHQTLVTNYCFKNNFNIKSCFLALTHLKFTLETDTALRHNHTERITVNRVHVFDRFNLPLY